MNVLSLFDGMAGARLALISAGFPVSNYYASEIDKFAIKVAMKNFPDITQLGPVEAIDKHELPKIDLLIAGSPCQGFSLCGKQLAFDDPRSKLFFQFVYMLDYLKSKNPEVKFLLENVNMKQQYLDIISDCLGVQPICINSALVSAQRRVRYYWTNIEGIEQPQDEKLVIWDILEDKGIPVIKSHGEYQLRPEKSMCIDANYWKGPDNHGQRTIILDCEELGHAFLNGHDFLKRVYSIWGKCPTLTAVCGGNQERKIAIDGRKWRKLTPIECERLQTVPDNYTEGVSNTQRYKMLGNGFNIKTVAHILSYMR